MAMIFTLISAVKDGAETIIGAEKAARGAVREREVAKAEEEENAKFHGERVTRERFLAWREGFRRELVEKEEEKKREEKEGEGKKKGPKGDDRLTGKELWERGLVGKVEEDEGEGMEPLANAG